MKRYLPFVIVVGVALVTFGSGTMLYRAKRPQVKNIPESQKLSLQKAMLRRTFAVTPMPRLRWKSLRDFQCPPCGNFAPFAEELLREYDSRLRVVFRNFPAPRPRARSRGRAGCGSRRFPGKILGDARHALPRTIGLEQGPECAGIVRIVRGHAGT